VMQAGGSSSHSGMTDSGQSHSTRRRSVWTAEGQQTPEIKSEQSCANQHQGLQTRINRAIARQSSPMLPRKADRELELL
jgi:hypothetical protein